MATYLLYDQGNTYTKHWRLRDGVPVDDCGDKADVAVWCSVADMMDAKQRRQWLLERAKTAFIVTPKTQAPIRVDYGTPGTLGADRVAAAVGAHCLFPGENLLVVDAGTCVTYDWVDVEGLFRGGNIAPGIGMQLDAMHERTAHLPRPQWEADDISLATSTFGTATDSALLHGVAMSIAGAARRCFDALPEPKRCLLTGGSAPRVSPVLDFPHAVVPDLMMHGLVAIYEHNKDLGLTE